jgi:hypothetical protein
MFFLLLPDVTSANGWLTESPSLKSGNLIMKKGIVLESEQVDIVLNNKDYNTTVTYNLRSKDNHFSGKLFFPILCKNVEYQTANIPCISNFKVLVSGEAAKSIREAPGVLRNFEAKFKTKIYDPNIIKKYMSTDSIMDHNIEEGAEVHLYSSNIHPVAQNFTITISYRSPYYYTESGTTKSSILSFSDDLIYYDFSPAAAWMMDAIASIKVNVDARNTVGKVTLPKEWKFSSLNGIFSSEIKNVHIPDIPPLIVAVDKKKYNQYLHHKATLKFAKVHYTVESIHSLPSVSQSYSPPKATDGDITTAWCSSKSQPELTMTISPVGNIPHTNECGFEGIGFINGYTKSKDLWKANRRVKSGFIEIGGVVKGKFSVTDLASNAAFDPYAAISFIDIQHTNSFFVVEQKEKNWHMTNRKEIKLRLKITETYPGEKFNDVCITEIYPIFNCY